MSTCRHLESLYGRCTACGMTWEQQAAVRERKAQADLLREVAGDPSLRLSGHSGVSVRGLLARADQIDGGAA